MIKQTTIRARNLTSRAAYDGGEAGPSECFLVMFFLRLRRSMTSTGCIGETAPSLGAVEKICNLLLDSSLSIFEMREYQLDTIMLHHGIDSEHVPVSEKVGSFSERKMLLNLN